MVGRVRVAEIGVVVQESVTFRQIGVQVAHGGGLQVDAEDMDRQAFGR